MGQRGVVLDFSRPGKPTDNAFIEAFNGRFRAGCLNQHWFLTVADAAEKLEAWRRYYNEERPHGAIGSKVPIMLTKSGGRHQPVTLSEAGKLCLRAAQSWGSDHLEAPFRVGGHGDYRGDRHDATALAHLEIGRI